MRGGSDREFRSLLEFIESRMEFESEYYNDAYLDRRISARMRRVDADDYRSYRRLLESDESERQALLDSLSINVTGFFRNPEAWESLREILRDLTGSPGTTRIWSAPCADGREPYSIAMLVLDDGDIDEDRVSILATDINRDVLRRARRGRYETSKTTDIEEELEPLDDYRPYIEQDGDTFTVRDTVKNLVTFERHDLIRGEQKSDFDLVCCRNLLIYIDADYKTPVFDTITGSLREHGYLMIGMTETLPREFRDVYEPVAKKRRLYRKV